MLKKIILITISVLVVIGAIAGVFLFKKFIYQDEETKFRKSLKGEIVFVRRDGLYLNIYKINADGTEERMLYHNPEDISASSPEWSEDGKKIYFRSIFKKGEKAKIFEMNGDGENVMITETKVSLNLVSHWTKEKDIIVKQGSIYYLNDEGNEVLVFPFKKNYDVDLNPGAWECSWGPDKKYIIFVLHGYITVINREGSHMAKITEGGDPDWKY